MSGAKCIFIYKNKPVEVKVRDRNGREGKNASLFPSAVWEYVEKCWEEKLMQGWEKRDLL